jgi:hypothetical protein
MEQDLSLYSTGAQVIPVLWIILVIELRVFGGEPKKGWISMEADERHRQAPWLWAVILWAVGFTMWTAEIIAVNVLVDGGPSEFSRQWIRLAIVLGAAWVFMMPIQPWFEAWADRVPWMKRGKDRSYARAAKRARERQRRQEEKEKP